MKKISVKHRIRLVKLLKAAKEDAGNIKRQLSVLYNRVSAVEKKIGDLIKHVNDLDRETEQKRSS